MNVTRLEPAASHDQATSAAKTSTRKGPAISPVWRPSSKIRDRHWERLADCLRSPVVTASGTGKP